MHEGIVMMEHPAVRCSVWLLLPHVLAKLSQEVAVELRVDSLTWRDKFLMDNPIPVEKADQHRLHIAFQLHCFLQPQ